jgi:hypothetical protein
MNTRIKKNNKNRIIIKGRYGLDIFKNSVMSLSKKGVNPMIRKRIKITTELIKKTFNIPLL